MPPPQRPKLLLHPLKKLPQKHQLKSKFSTFDDLKGGAARLRRSFLSYLRLYVAEDVAFACVFTHSPLYWPMKGVNAGMMSV